MTFVTEGITFPSSFALPFPPHVVGIGVDLEDALLEAGGVEEGVRCLEN
jgi:hypothetical protein